MKLVQCFVCSVLGLVLLAGCRPSAQVTPANGQTAAHAGDNLVAIDVLLEPDQTMVSKANALNARLRGNYPDGYSLDATHAPHVTFCSVSSGQRTSMW